MRAIDELPKNVHDRLEYLEFMLRFRGWISRSDLIDSFGIGEAAATRDIRLYKDMAEQNLVLNQRSKKYEIVEDLFTPIFELKVSSALSKLRTSKVSHALGMGDANGILCPRRLSLPKIDFLAKVTRAISGKKLLKISYRSIQNGQSKKVIRPHAIFDNGMHWYVRGYDESAPENPYRSYALTRIMSIEIADLENDDHTIGSESNDHQWNRVVNLELVPHPNKKNVPNPKTIEHDFDMVKGVTKIEVRAAIAGYWLQHWNVDCTENHTLKGYQYQLCLKNHQALYDVESRKIAPGLSDYS